MGTPKLSLQETPARIAHEARTHAAKAGRPRIEALTRLPVENWPALEARAA